MNMIEEIIKDRLNATGWDATSYGDLLYAFVKALRPNLVLEIGTFKGFSALCIAKALNENEKGMLHAVDANPRFSHDGVPPELLSRIVEHKMDSASQEFVDFLTGLGPIDLAFIDGNHSYNYCKRDFLNVWPLLSEGGIAALHDSDKVTVRKFVDEIVDQYPTITLPVIGGIAIVQKSRHDPAKNLEIWGLPQ